MASHEREQKAIRCKIRLVPCAPDKENVLSLKYGCFAKSFILARKSLLCPTHPWLRLQLLIGMTWFAESDHWQRICKGVSGNSLKDPLMRKCKSLGCLFGPLENEIRSFPTRQFFFKKRESTCCVLFVIKKYCFQLAFWVMLLLWLCSVGMLTNASQQTCKLPTINKSITSKVKQRVRYYWVEATASCCWPGTNNGIKFCWEKPFKS